MIERVDGCVLCYSVPLLIAVVLSKLYDYISFLFTRRAALESWKLNLGSNATYNNLIGVFERARCQSNADTVRGLSESLTSLTAIEPPVATESTQQSVRKECIIS